jgi:hypothetical protein
MTGKAITEPFHEFLLMEDCLVVSDTVLYSQLALYFESRAFSIIIQPIYHVYDVFTYLILEDR